LYQVPENGVFWYVSSISITNGQKRSRNGQEGRTVVTKNTLERIAENVHGHVSEEQLCLKISNLAKKSKNLLRKLSALFLYPIFGILIEMRCQIRPWLPFKFKFSLRSN
jgi:hypothetical protein